MFTFKELRALFRSIGKRKAQLMAEGSYKHKRAAEQDDPDMPEGGGGLGGPTLHEYEASLGVTLSPVTPKDCAMHVMDKLGWFVEEFEGDGGRAAMGMVRRRRNKLDPPRRESARMRAFFSKIFTIRTPNEKIKNLLFQLLEEPGFCSVSLPPLRHGGVKGGAAGTAAAV